MYSLQRNAHGNLIICKDHNPRKSYQIIATGDYNELLKIKLGA